MERGVGCGVLAGPLVNKVGFDDVGREVGCEVFVVVGVGTAVGVLVGEVGWDVDGPGVVTCNLRLIDFVSEVLPTSAEDSTSVIKTSCSFGFTEHGVLSLVQASSELMEPGAYPSFEHMSSSDIH